VCLYRSVFNEVVRDETGLMLINVASGDDQVNVLIRSVMTHQCLSGVISRVMMVI